MKSIIGKKILICAASALVLIALTVQSPMFGTPFSYLPLALIVGAITGAIMFIGTLVYDLIKKTKFSLNFLMVVIVSLGSFWGSLKIADQQIASTKSRVATINDALEKYFADHKKYPDRLDEIVPKYIAEVPKTDMGIIKTDYKYIKYGGDDDYWLGFEELFKAKWVYIKSRESWVLDD